MRESLDEGKIVLWQFWQDKLKLDGKKAKHKYIYFCVPLELRLSFSATWHPGAPLPQCFSIKSMLRNIQLNWCKAVWSVGIGWLREFQCCGDKSFG